VDYKPRRQRLWSRALARHGADAREALAGGVGGRSRGCSVEAAELCLTVQPACNTDYEASSINLIALSVRAPFGDLSSSMPE